MRPISSQSSPKSNYLFWILASLVTVLTSFSGFSQETLKAELSIKEYSTIFSYVKQYYTIGDKIITIKYHDEKTHVYQFDKISQTIQKKQAVTRKKMIWIDAFERENLLYCFYCKKNILAQFEVYLDILNLETCEFVQEQKLLFATKWSVYGILDHQTMLLDVFNSSLSDNKDYLTFSYFSHSTNRNLYNIFSFTELQMMGETVIQSTLNEPMVLIDSKVGNNGEFFYLAKTENAQKKILGIMTENGSQIQNIPLSEYLEDIDSFRFFKNESNENLLIGGTYFWDGDISKPANFAMEINYEGALVNKTYYFPDNYRGLEILNISLKEGKSFCLTTANFETNEISHEFVNSNGNALKSFKNSPHLLSYLGPNFYYPYFRIVESEHFKDVFYFSKNSNTGFKDLYLNRFSKTENTFKDYLILENEKIENLQVKQIILSGIIPSVENTYYLEVSLEKEKDALITINLK